jgi:hypothetical protein
VYTIAIMCTGWCNARYVQKGDEEETAFEMYVDVEAHKNSSPLESVFLQKILGWMNA